MIISRKEFHTRMDFQYFDAIETKDEIMSVETLFKETQADAPFRNHSYLFEKGMDFDKLPLQENTVGIKKQYPHIETEGDRIKHIKKEIEDDTYESIPVFCDIDYPCVLYIDDGFHRIYSAHILGQKTIRVKKSYGKFILRKSISFNNLIDLLGMVNDLFVGKKKTIKVTDVRAILVKLKEKDPEKVDNYSISYGQAERANSEEGGKMIWNLKDKKKKDKKKK